MNKSDSIKNLAEALSKAQAEMPPAKFNSTNPFLKNKYADLGAIIDTARPFLAKNGLSVSQLTYSVGEQVGVETVLMHNSGEWISGSISMAVADEKGKSGAQVAGSIITYLRRYGLSAILGMYTDEDSDGHVVKPAEQTTTQSAKVEQPTPEPAPLEIADIYSGDGRTKDNPAYDLSKLDLTSALKTTDSNGQEFNDLTSETISHMATEYVKRLKANSNDIETKWKLAAAKLVMKERANGSVA